MHDDEIAAIVILEGEDLTVSELGTGNTLYLLAWFLTSISERGLSGFLDEVLEKLENFQARAALENYYSIEAQELPTSFMLH